MLPPPPRPQASLWQPRVLWHSRALPVIPGEVRGRQPCSTEHLSPSVLTTTARGLDYYGARFTDGDVRALAPGCTESQWGVLSVRLEAGAGQSVTDLGAGPQLSRLQPPLSLLPLRISTFPRGSCLQDLHPLRFLEREAAVSGLHSRTRVLLLKDEQECFPSEAGIISFHYY